MEKPMHIVFLVKDYGSGKELTKHGLPAKSGAEFHVERHARQFAEFGHTVTIFAKKGKISSPFRERLSYATLYRLPSGLRAIIVIFFLLFNKSIIDVLYIFGQTSYTFASMIVAKACGIPAAYVSTMTGEAFEPIRRDKYFPETWKPFRRLYNNLLGLCTCFIAISKEIATEMAEKYGANRVYQIGQGVDTVRFSPVSAIEKLCIREKIGIPLDKVIILFCSRLDARKGFDILLKSWPQIRVRTDNVHLLVVGGGKKSDVNDLLAIDAGDITYVGEAEDPIPYYRASDIFLLPSRREGLPNVLMEAMACECACVVSDIGGCVDLIIHEETGLLFPSGDQEKMIDAVTSLTKQQHTIEKLGHNARALCQGSLDIRVVCRRLINVFRQLRQTYSKSEYGKCES